ncbi:hypothetical protein J7K86_01955 [bacterium]|nr:hypothetical protein [bacterium]
MFKEKFMPTNEPEKKIPKDVQEKLEELGKEFKKIAEDMKSEKKEEKSPREIVADLIFETIHENRGNEAVEKFLKYEEAVNKLPQEIKKNPREGLINQMVISYEKRKNMFDNPEELKESMKKAILYFLEKQAERGKFEIPRRIES